MTGRVLGHVDTYGRVKPAPVEMLAEPAPGLRNRELAPSKRRKHPKREWVLSVADRRAWDAGCRFVEPWADHVCQVIEGNFRLWQGEYAGEPFILLPWERQVLRHLFGWARWSDHWGRWVRRFRKASIWVAKKNGKSPLAAAVGMYLLKWDGEAGQQVFSAARDRNQAQIVHRHAQHMLRQFDPQLLIHFGINRTSGVIEYPKGFATYAILSGENFRAQEGLNGSVIIDETHVVDARLGAVLADMGASRAESLQFEVSTAGDDPTGYGRQQYEYGKAVQAGDVDDPAFFFCCWEPPQDATDDQIARNPKIWKAANPAWGKLIDPTEFKGALTRARRSNADWAAFKQRRVQIWQKSASPFIRGEVWDACGGRFEPGDLAGCGGGLGLDLSRVRDMTAAVFVCERDDRAWQYPLFFLPEGSIETLAGYVPAVSDWVDQAWINVIPGDVINFAKVREVIQEHIAIIQPTHLVYDPAFAEDMTAKMEEESGIERVPMKQTFDQYCGPTDDYERMIVAGKLRHPNHPVLNWQMGHCMIKVVAGKKKPLKDDKARYKSIDGVQAGIMGLRGLVESKEYEPQESVYETRGVMRL